MHIIIYDRELTPLGLIEKITSFIWVRRYWSAGQFTLLVPFTEQHIKLLKMYRIIMRSGDNEAGEIRYVQKRKNSQGLEVIEVQGQLLTYWIGKRLVLQQIRATAPLPAIMTRIVTENITNPTNTRRRIANITHTSIAGIQRGNVEYTSEPFINALLALEQAGRASKIGFQIFTDIRERRHFYRVYDGRNLTADQTENPPCVFSAEFDNVLEQEFTNSTERLRSTAYVGGEETHDRPRRIVEVGGQAAGLDRAEVFINATDIRQRFRDENNNEIVISDTQLIALLSQRGSVQLENFAETLAFTSKINTHSNLRYKEDYDLGDRVTCINRRWGVRINVRITEIMEIYSSDNVPELEITFGESIPALIDTIRALYVQEG